MEDWWSDLSVVAKKYRVDKRILLAVAQSQPMTSLRPNLESPVLQWHRLNYHIPRPSPVLIILILSYNMGGSSLH